MSNNGPYTLGIPCSIGDTVYIISVKNQNVKSWYVWGIQRFDEDNDWTVILKDKNNKFKFSTKKVKFKSFGITVHTDKYKAEEALKKYSEKKSYIITGICGHKHEVRLAGTPLYVKNRIKHLQGEVCPVCKNKQSERAGLKPVKMAYSTYASQYKSLGCDTKVGSYDSNNHTIEVYL